MSKDMNVPELRFKGFSGEWDNLTLGDLGSVAMNKRIFKHQTCLTGDVPFFKIGTFGKQPDAFISKALFDEYKAKYPYPLTGDLLLSASGSIGRIVEYKGEEQYFQDSNIVWLKHDGKINNDFLRVFYSIVKWSGLEGSTIQRLYNKNILDTEISVPERSEQTRIGNSFQKLDSLINQHQQKHDKLNNIKKAMLERMFPKQGKTIPEIRFKGFSEEWEEKPLDDLCNLITKQTGFDYSATIKPSLVRAKSSQTFSFIQNKDFSGPNINLETDFFIPCKVANKYPRILIDVPSVLISISGKIGNVGFYQLPEKSLVGGAVGICKLKCASDGLVIIHQLLSKVGQEYFQTLTKSSSHANITVEDIRLIKIKLPPTVKEKIKLGEYFNQLDALINQHQQQITKLNNIKQACLNKMFV